MIELKPLQLHYGETHYGSSYREESFWETKQFTVKNFLWALDIESFIEASSSVLGLFWLLTYADELDYYIEQNVKKLGSLPQDFELPDEITLIITGNIGASFGGLIGVVITGLSSIVAGKSDKESLYGWCGSMCGSACSLAQTTILQYWALEWFLTAISEESYIRGLTQDEVIDHWTNTLKWFWGVGSVAPTVWVTKEFLVESKS